MNKSCAKIQKALFKFYDKKLFQYMCTNTQALDQEADFVAVSRSQFITECEIKISRSDFFKDFKKDFKHSRMVSNYEKHGEPTNTCVNYFYFVCPDNLIKIQEVPNYAGLMYVNERGAVTVIRTAPLIHKQKVTTTIIIRLLRSVMYKYFNNLQV